MSEHMLTPTVKVINSLNGGLSVAIIMANWITVAAKPECKHMSSVYCL